MYRYIFFVILGIILSIILYLYNRKENFSVGCQFEQSIVELNKMAKRIAMGMADPAAQLCAISGVGPCQLTQENLGGGCTINSLTGLLYTSASFTPEYLSYLNENMSVLPTQYALLNHYKCLMNMPNMVATLESNRLNPRNTHLQRINNNTMMNLGHEYSINYHTLYLCSYIYKFEDIEFYSLTTGIKEIGHAFLIYRINKERLGILIANMDENGLLNPDVGGRTFSSILENLRAKHTSMVDGSFGLLIIDYCNNVFDIITYESYPPVTHTTDNVLTYSASADPSDGVNAEVDEYTVDYNKMWILKIIWYWMELLGYEARFNDMTVSRISGDDDKERFNIFVLSRLDYYELYMYQTYKLNAGESVNIEECESILRARVNASGVGGTCSADVSDT